MTMHLFLYEMRRSPANTTTTYIYAGENPIGRYVDDGNGGTTIAYYLEDANDSISALTNNAGVKTQTYAYDAFGNVRPGSDPPQLGFHAAWHDPSSGLIDMRARSYDPQTGRFTAPDPVAPDPQAYESFHPYAFANHNPHVFSDPTGGFSLTELNITTAIQSSLNGLRSIALNKIKNEVRDQVTEAATEILLNQVAGFFPVNLLVSTLRPEGATRRLQGLNLQSALEDLLCNVLPASNYLHFDVPITPQTGRAVGNGVSCGSLFKLRSNPRHTVRPDFVVNSELPVDAADIGARSLLVGDVTLRVTTLINKYRRGGRQRSQAEGIMNHAANHGIRIAAFVTFFDADQRKKTRLQQVLFKDFYREGVVTFLIALGPKDRGR